MAMPAGTYTPKTHNTNISMNMRGVFTSNEAAAWPTHTGVSRPFLLAEMALIRHCHQRDCWNKSDRTWLSGLMSTGLLARPSGAAIGSTWYFPFSSCGGGPHS